MVHYQSANSECHTQEWVTTYNNIDIKSEAEGLHLKHNSIY